MGIASLLGTKVAHLRSMEGKAGGAMIVGVILLAVGVFCHSQADLWPTFTRPSPVNPGQTYQDVDPGISSLFNYGGLVLTILGGLLVCLGVIRMLYPPRELP